VVGIVGNGLVKVGNYLSPTITISNNLAKLLEIIYFAYISSKLWIICIYCVLTLNYLHILVLNFELFAHIMY
jgi:hypothetical protein